MRWRTVTWIFRRELRDQLRDRRTLFMIVVLPILLYPMMGLGVLRMTPALEQTPLAIAVVAPEEWPQDPPLIVRDGDGWAFSEKLFEDPAEAKMLRVLPAPREGWDDPEERRARLRAGEAYAVILPPADFAERVARQFDDPGWIDIGYDGADERGQLAYAKARDAVTRWIDRFRAERLEERGRPYTDAVPFRTRLADAATAAESGGSVWSKLFPFLLIIMSLTGAFYPSLDLCAGEKERGTMETLLIAPAGRGEIVLGKFLTVMCASFATATLNLASMAITGLQIARQFRSIAGAAGRSPEAMIAPPSWEALGWMLALLVPLSFFFAAISLAVATLAKSMKEGQYYMTPLYLGSIPLTMLAMAPGVELSPSLSLTPVTGPALLLRELLQGDYAQARPYLAPVLLSTLAYGIIALRWAVSQFRREDILFRDAERFDPAVWLRHLRRDRPAIPAPGAAVFCFAIMIASAWFIALGVGSDTAGLILGQVGYMLLPPLLLALSFTGSPRDTLRLRWPGWGALGLAAGLALALHPLVQELRAVIEHYLPVSDSTQDLLNKFMGTIPNLATALLGFAIIPAICEEAAFRGYILSGLGNGRPAWRAIVEQALLFGLIHAVLSLSQQFFNAALLGLLLGLVAIRTGSLLPGVVFHAINNGLTIALAIAGGASAAPALYRDPGKLLYAWPVVIGGAILSVVLATPLIRRQRPKSEDIE